MHEARSISPNGRSSGQRDRLRDPLDHPAAARVYVDGSGSITEISDGAKKLLGYGAGSSIDHCFFSHIHGRNMLQVMRDIASMVCHDRTSAQWIVRMRTAERDWVWVRLVARKHAGATNSVVSIVIDAERVSA